MRKPKLFYAMNGIGAALGAICGYITLGDYVAAYSIGALGLAVGFMAWVVLAHLVDD